MKTILPPLLRSDPSWALFLAFAFLAGFSMPLARVALVASLVATLANKARRRSLRITGPTIGWFAYLALALLVSGLVWAFDPDPLLRHASGFRKITKLLWFAAIPLAVVQVDSRPRLIATLQALVLGCSVTALAVLILNPLLAGFQLSYPTETQMAAGTASPFGETLYRAVSSLHLQESVNAWIYDCGRRTTFEGVLIKLGTMQSAQRLMVAIPAALCLFFESRRSPKRSRAIQTILLLVLCFAALLLTYKRGPILAAGVVSIAILCSRLSWKRMILVLAALAVVLTTAVATVPPLRTRFSELPTEFEIKKGGRAKMWTQIVPALHREHPYGVGFRALTWEKMFSLDRRKRVELAQNHVHSVPLQSFVDFGWAGLAVYLLWMILGFRATEALARCARVPAADSSLPETACFMAPLAMFAALVFYGFVEYNLADSEVVLLYGLVLGLTSPSLRHSAAG